MIIVVICRDFTCSCKSNYHMIATTAALILVSFRQMVWKFYRLIQISCFNIVIILLLFKSYAKESKMERMWSSCLNFRFSLPRVLKFNFCRVVLTTIYRSSLILAMKCDMLQSYAPLFYHDLLHPEYSFLFNINRKEAFVL